METIYNVDYFIKKFEAIPESSWGKINLDTCALGHCGMTHLSSLVRYKSKAGTC